jgi:uncharacterized protein
VNKSLVVVVAAALALVSTGAMADPIGYSNSYNFLKAVRERDGNKVTELTSAPGASVVVNTREPGTGNTALHLVAQERDFDWLRFLIAKGARPDQQNKAGETPLNLAARVGWTEGVQFLLGRNVSANSANSKGETPLIIAVQRRDVPMVRLLLSRGADPKRADSVAGYSALDYAKQDPRAAAILKMLEAPPAKADSEVAGPTL